MPGTVRARKGRLHSLKDGFVRSAADTLAVIEYVLAYALAL